MKNLFKFSSLIVCSLLISFSVNAQKSKKEFQGTVTYDITYPGATLDAATKSQLPTEEIVKVKGCNSKTEFTTGMATQIKITNATTKSVIVLIDAMGTKYALKKTEAEITASMAQTPMPTVNITVETKTIAGYLCKKAILTTNEEDGTVSNDTIYFTEDLGCKDYNFSSSFKDVPGVVLEYSQYIDQISASMKYLARLVKKEKISDTEFIIPNDYQEVTEEELKKAFGG